MSYSPLSVRDNFTKWTPVIAVYYRGPLSISSIVVKITSADVISISDGTTTVTTTYVDRNIRDVVASLNASTNVFDVVALLDIGPENMIAKALICDEYNTDKSADGAFLIRYTGHIARYLERNVLQLKGPTAKTSFEPWYARIGNGTIRTRFSDISFTSYPGINPDAIYTFGIEEFINQDWSVLYGTPYKDVFGELPSKIDYSSTFDGSVLSLSKTPILFKNNISVLIKGVRQSNSIIRHVDTNNGLVYLNTKIDKNLPVTVDYTYREEDYLYDAIDLNASLAHNPLLVDSYVAFYLKPISSNGAMISGGKSIFHEILNTEVAGKHKIAQPISSTLNSNNVLYEPVIYLGSISVRQVYDRDSIEVIDTRTRGGGVKYGKEDSWAETRYYYDIGSLDGACVPGNAAIVINIPCENTTNVGMSPEEVKFRTTKDIALGVAPIVNIVKSYDVGVSTTAISALTRSADNNAQVIISPAFWTDNVTTPTYFRTNQVSASMVVRVTNTSVFGITIGTSCYSTNTCRCFVFSTRRSSSSDLVHSEINWQHNIQPVIGKSYDLFMEDLDPNQEYTIQIVTTIGADDPAADVSFESMMQPQDGAVNYGQFVDITGFAHSTGATFLEVKYTKPRKKFYILSDSNAEGTVTPAGVDAEYYEWTSARFNLITNQTSVAVFNNDVRGSIVQWEWTIIETYCKNNGYIPVVVNNSHGGAWQGQMGTFTRAAHTAFWPGCYLDCIDRFKYRTNYSNTDFTVTSDWTGGWSPDVILLGSFENDVLQRYYEITYINGLHPTEIYFDTTRIKDSIARDDGNPASIIRALRLQWSSAKLFIYTAHNNQAVAHASITTKDYIKQGIAQDLANYYGFAVGQTEYNSNVGRYVDIEQYSAITGLDPITSALHPTAAEHEGIRLALQSEFDLTVGP